jgi:hypothetical protein
MNASSANPFVALSRTWPVVSVTCLTRRPSQLLCRPSRARRSFGICLDGIACLEAATFSFEVVVVDDGSRPRSLRRFLAQCASRLPCYGRVFGA